MGAHIPKVGILVVLAPDTRGTDKVNEVEGITLVEIHRSPYTITCPSCLKAQVELVHLFPSEVTIL